jgi:sugar phosphate isomerase/epimerase
MLTVMIAIGREDDYILKIGVQTSPILDRVGIEQGFKLISESGFNCVELSINRDYPPKNIVEGKGAELFEKSDEDIREYYRPYKEAAEKYHIAFSQAHAPFPSYVESEQGNEYVLDAIRKSIMVCGYLGCPYLVVHPSFFAYNNMLTAEQEWKVNIERYSALIDDARTYNVIICLENMFITRQGRVYGAICSEMSEANRYIDTLNEIAGEKRFAFCLDTGHALLTGKEINRAIMELGHRLAILHLHDNDGRNDQHLFPYMGILDWDRVCQGLKNVGFKGVLSFETGNALRVFDPALMPQCLQLLAATGRLFASKIEE